MDKREPEWVRRAGEGARIGKPVIEGKGLPVKVVGGRSLDLTYAEALARRG